MNLKVLFFSIILLVTSLFMLPDVNASDEVLIYHEFIDGFVDFSWGNESDKVVFKVDGYSELDIRSFDESPFRLKLTTLYQSIVITDHSNNQVVQTFTDFEYIILDTYTVRDGYMKIITDNDEYHMQFEPIKSIHFDKSSNYVKVETGLTFVSDVDSPISFIDTKDSFIVWDNFDGNLTESITVIENEFEGNENNVGEYNVKLYVEDSSANGTYLDYIISVRDMTRPVITPIDKSRVSYLEVFDITMFLEDLVVTDNVTVSENITKTIISDDYSNNTNDLGTYTVKVSVKDESGNESIYTHLIDVIDDVAPIITGTQSYNITLEDNLTLEYIKSQLTVYDEVDGDELTINVSTNEYQYNENIVGEYTIRFYSTDLSKNKTFFDVIVNVTDVTPPTFYINLNHILVNNLVVYNDEELLELLSNQISFEFDDLYFTINEYKNNETSPGVYRLGLNATHNGKTTQLQTIIRVLEEKESIVNETSSPWYRSIWGIIGLSSIPLSGVVIVIIKRRRR